MDVVTLVMKASEEAWLEIEGLEGLHLNSEINLKSNEVSLTQTEKSLDRKDDKDKNR